MRPPRDAVVAVTHRCNAHCVMCNIWKSRAPDALRPEHLRKLPPGLRTINLSGGEPFLRNDLPEFVRQAKDRCPGAKITISTNAYLPDRIVRMMGEIHKIDPAVRLAVSLDGVGAAHDRIRGDQGTFDKAVSLIESLTADGFHGLRLSMTLSDLNLDQVLPVAEFASRRGLEVGMVAAHSAVTHLGVWRAPLGAMPDWLTAAFRKIVAAWLRSWRPKQWLRAHFAYHTYRYLAGRRWRFRCRAGTDFFFLQADGTVYSCSVQGQPMGNIATQDWNDIWRGSAADEARRFVAQCPESCWMICTARGVYRAHPAAVACWLAWHKLLAHLRLLHLPTAAQIAERPELANPPR